MTNTANTTTISLIAQLVARRTQIQQVIGWMDPTKPGYDRLSQSLQAEISGITAALADCAHALVTSSADDTPNLDSARATFDGAAPWYVDADVATVLQMQADFASDWIAELVDG